jgi:hypothetical protein
VAGFPEKKPLTVDAARAHRRAHDVVLCVSHVS